MLINVFSESLFLVIDVMLGFCKSFTKGSLFFVQTVQATLKWAAQRMHSKVIRLVMQNANTTTPMGSAQSSALHVSRQHLRTVGKV